MIRLIIPQVPFSENEIRSLLWTDYGKVQLREMKELWIDEIWVAIRLRTRHRPLTKARISIKIFFRTERARDADNYPCKEVIDALRHNGLIADDSYDAIGKVNIDITGRDRETPRTEITIEERSLD